MLLDFVKGADAIILPVEIYRFIEYELLHFEKYKRMYKRMRERLSDSSNKLMIKGTLVFDELYGNHRTDTQGICMDIHISYEMFKKCKHEIIMSAARELGLLVELEAIQKVQREMATSD